MSNTFVNVLVNLY